MDIERLRAKVDPHHTALVVVDMQRDYCCEGGIISRLGFDVAAPAALGPKLRQFLSRVRPKLNHVVHLRQQRLAHLNSPAMVEHYGRSGLARDPDPRWSEHFEVVPGNGDDVIDKYKYSGFVGSHLEPYLKANRIETLVVTGVATEVCVESTVRDAFMRDYSVVVPRDLTEGTSEEAKRSSLCTIDRFFGEVVDAAALLTCWDA